MMQEDIIFFQLLKDTGKVSSSKIVTKYRPGVTIYVKRYSGEGIYLADSFGSPASVS